MQTTPNIIRGLLLAGILVVVLTSVYTTANLVAGTSSKVVEKNEEALTFKKSIALNAIKEYDRWHLNGTLRETDADAIPILKEYWKLGVIPVTDKNLQSSSWQYHHPWSAVFISYVMLQSGAGDDFPYANNHAKYIVWARDNATQISDPLFAAYSINDTRAAWPEPGDLICMNRRSKQYNLQTINKNCISHCDIVVEVNKEKGFIVAIGGNVGQTVNKRIVWLDQYGYIDTSKNWQVTDAAENDPEGTQKEVFAIIKVNNKYKL